MTTVIIIYALSVLWTIYLVSNMKIMNMANCFLMAIIWPIAFFYMVFFDINDSPN